MQLLSALNVLNGRIDVMLGADGVMLGDASGSSSSDSDSDSDSGSDDSDD